MATIQRYQEKAPPQVNAAVRAPAAIASLGRRDPAAAAFANNQSAAAIREALQIQEQGHRSIEAAAAKQMSLGQAFDTVAQVGDKFFKLGLRLVDAQQETTQRANRAAAAKELQEVLTNLQHEPDFTKLEETYRQKAQEIKEKYGQGLIGGYAAEWEADFTTMALSGQRQVRKLAWNKSVDARAATRLQLRQAGMQAIINDPSQRNQEQQTDAFLKALNEDINAGVLDRKAAAKEFLDWQHDLSLFNVKRLIETQPMTAYGLLTGQQKYGKGHPKEGETVPLPVGLKLSEVNELTKQAKAKAEDWAVDRAYALLNQQFGEGNFNAKLAAAKKMEGLPFDARRKLITAMRTDQRIINDAQKKAKENALDKGLTLFWQSFNEGDLQTARATIDLLEQKGIIDPDKAQAKRKLLLEQVHETDPKVYTDTLKNLENLSRVQILDLAGRGLSPKDAEHLAEKRDKWLKGKGPVNYLTKAAADFKKVFKGKDYAKQESDFIARLEDEMKAEGLTPYNAKVADLARGLMEKIDVPGWSDEPAFVEKTRRRRQGQPYIGMIRDVEGRPAFDPQLPGLKPKELQEVYEILEKRGVENPTAQDKQMALVEMELGPKAYEAAYKTLAEGGKMITPETIRGVWKLYGKKLLEK